MTASSRLLNLLIVRPSKRTSSRRKWSLIVEKTIRGGAILSYRMTDRFPQSRGTGQKVTFCQSSPAVDTMAYSRCELDSVLVTRIGG